MAGAGVAGLSAAKTGTLNVGVMPSPSVVLTANKVRRDVTVWKTVVKTE